MNVQSQGITPQTREQSMTAAQAAVRPYYVPKPSHWPIIGACALLLAAVGAATWLNRGSAGPYILAAGALALSTAASLLSTSSGTSAPRNSLTAASAS